MSTENTYEEVETEIVGNMPNSTELIARAEIDIQIATAKKYPRQLSKVRSDVLTLATMDEETAGACFFSLPRGGKVITGESVRLAEILASAYGNIKAAWRPVSVDRINGVVTCQGVCHDLEKNVSSSVEKTRTIQKKRGSDRYDEDMINLAVNACGAIAYRDALFKVIPKALIKPILNQIKEAARGKGTLTQRVDRIFKRLIEMGKESKISDKDMEARILAVIGCSKREDVSLSHLDVLIGMGTSITDGEIRLEKAFPHPSSGRAPDIDLPEADESELPPTD